MAWFLTAILAYFFSALVAIIDKHLLSGPLPHPRVYAFYIGILGIIALALIPFGFLVPSPLQIFISLLAGALFIYALFWFFKALHRFEASRIVPAVGGLTPLFLFGLIYLIENKIFSLETGLSFILLISGSVLITFKKGQITLKSFQFSAITAILFALSFFLAKMVYEAQPFISGFIWMRIGGFLLALLFLVSKASREKIFMKRLELKKKVFGIFVLGQFFGAVSAVLQNLAIALVPITLLAFVSALEGTKYIFLLIFSVFLSLKFPNVLKEEISRETLIQKIISILLITGGLILLAF